ncbi:methylated-DNA--[protein]-cysteine S-methyltransferase [Alginatibacterium sediminis]|uniref:methylated-DNA--[protein]-cysteine S-methyltransferase n=1 Tax=Alginatibacterium sediminis TaxID=2164068 RepID=A0A420EGE7_9ALTE|nr:methylated-DNA--[protein]-cysteine S-methyltransferase [Alginatibacterium sediminis]RKF19743.1 methylated-DNA--[protein]-cysteine S-methyltransferase [Alginatibacterium sediminis]
MPYIEKEFFKIGSYHFVAASYQQQLCMFDYQYRKQGAQIEGRLQQQLGVSVREHSCDTNRQGAQQVEQYLLGQRQQFDLPLLLVGTSFQKLVWQQLLQIPYGKTTSYAQLADAIGESKAIRAVGAANGANALAIIVPCHRVIASDGNLTGYAGGLALKKKLLKLETSMF